MIDLPLLLQGKSTDHIWLMEDVEGYIGIRMDSGDRGTVYLTHAQATDLLKQLATFIAEPGAEKLAGEQKRTCEFEDQD